MFNSRSNYFSFNNSTNSALNYFIARKYTHQRSYGDDAGCGFFDVMCSLSSIWCILNHFFTLDVDRQRLTTRRKIVSMPEISFSCQPRYKMKPVMTEQNWSYTTMLNISSHHEDKMVGTTSYPHKIVNRRISQEIYNTMVLPGHIAGTISQNSKSLFLIIETNYDERYIDHVEKKWKKIFYSYFSPHKNCRCVPLSYVIRNYAPSPDDVNNRYFQIIHQSSLVGDMFTIDSSKVLDIIK